jgi:hypothetical protein
MAVAPSGSRTSARAIRSEVGGEVVSERPVFTRGTQSSTLPLTLRVTDTNGRTTWTHQAVADGR